MAAATDSAVERVGMLGLGSMGRPIAANIAKAGFKVWGFDPRSEALDAAERDGVSPCTSPNEVGRSVEAVLAIPYDFGQVEQSVFGSSSVLEGLRQPSPLVMMSTVGPDNARSVAQRLAERGHSLIDAPVTGGAEGATAGTLTMMVGAPAAELGRVRPVLETFTKNIFHVGPEPGAGQAAKMANQLLVITHMVAMSEALMLGVRNGVDARQLYDILSSGSANSYVFGHRGKVVLDRTFKTGGSLNILVKDGRLVQQAADSSGTPLFVLSAAKQIFELARTMGLGELDDANVARVYEQLTGRAISEDHKTLATG
jgi:3-hydroxyisobutyrate dehydrogenase-like beta-hydroxyacid dehydrogenase